MVGTVWISATSRLLRNAISATSEQQRHEVCVQVSGQQSLY